MSTKLKKLLVGATAAGVAAGAALTAGLGVNADPVQYSAFVGVGSDTTQDVLNALANGTSVGGTDYLGLRASDGRGLVSFDATNPVGADPCLLATKIGGPGFNRPNGSSQGRRALSRALDLTGYGNASCGGPVNVQGQVDFARSSSGPASGDTGTALTYIPFARDGVSLGYYRAGVTPPADPVTSTSSQLKTRWTRAELTSLFTAADGTAKTFTADDGSTSIQVLACGIQTGSGTYGFWNTVTTATAGQEDTATSVCNDLLGTDVRAQENDSEDLKARGDAVGAGTQVVIGFSAGAYIAKSNGVAEPDPQADNVGIAAITDAGGGVNLGNPIQGTAPNLTPVAAFFNNGTFGRSIFNVLPTPVATGPGNVPIKSLFVGASSAVCQSTEVIEAYGFLVSPDCGSTTTLGSLLSGQL